TDEQLKKIATTQMERKEWLKLLGMDYYIFIPPMAHSIYPEFLPSTFKKTYPLTKTEQVVDYLQKHTDLKVITVNEHLLKYKKHHLLYYKGDTHWNHYGAFYSYQYLVDYFKNI